MRRKLILLGLGAALLCLCGCGGLDKRNARMEDLALLRVLAVAFLVLQSITLMRDNA